MRVGRIGMHVCLSWHGVVNRSEIGVLESAAGCLRGSRGGLRPAGLIQQRQLGHSVARGGLCSPRLRVLGGAERAAEGLSGGGGRRVDGVGRPGGAVSPVGH
jgi:hypothetical protein